MNKMPAPKVERPGDGYKGFDVPRSRFGEVSPRDLYLAVSLGQVGLDEAQVRIPQSGGSSSVEGQRVGLSAKPLSRLETF